MSGENEERKVGDINDHDPKLLEKFICVFLFLNNFFPAVPLSLICMT